MTLQFGKTYWGWATSKDGMVSGNHESRDEALGAARRMMGPEYTGEIWLVSVECPDLHEASAAHLESMIEELCK